MLISLSICQCQHELASRPSRDWYPSRLRHTAHCMSQAGAALGRTARFCCREGRVVLTNSTPFVKARRGQTRSTGGAGVGGSYGPAQQQSNSGNAADPSDPRPHITRSSGGAGVEGTYGPDDASVKAIVDSSKQSAKKSPEVQEQDAGLKAEANMPDPMVAPDDGSLAQESGANVQGRIDVGAAVGSVRSKL